MTAQIDDRLITAEIKEKKVAEKEYDEAIRHGQTATLLRQSEETLDTFTVDSVWLWGACYIINNSFRLD